MNLEAITEADNIPKIVRINRNKAYLRFGFKCRYYNVDTVHLGFDGSATQRFELVYEAPLERDRRFDPSPFLETIFVLFGYFKYDDGVLYKIQIDGSPLPNQNQDMTSQAQVDDRFIVFQSRRLYAAFMNGLLEDYQINPDRNKEPAQALLKTFRIFSEVTAPSFNGNNRHMGLLNPRLLEMGKDPILNKYIVKAREMIRQEQQALKYFL